ncbi:hypothetical protein P4T20_04935 [Aneurinibacillus thermoaerophilus]|uniref:hypothetical protein n=1 Tax=Aneurinibacillus TaxID=55079 RepID=UPI0012E35187|nr:MULTISPECIES: hypothetical protein [Aneurinibacillus]MED0678649.1 hypothetical protein [Aneurinibacillus thermoaerophilus]
MVKDTPLSGRPDGGVFLFVANHADQIKVDIPLCQRLLLHTSLKYSGDIKGCQRVLAGSVRL